MAAYATIADLIARYDVRTIGDLVNDDNTQADTSEVLADADGVILAALTDASGEIDASLLRGKRYTRTDLAGLTGNAANHLKRITCKIAFWLLWERRPAWENDSYEQSKADARRALKELASGEEVFELEAQQNAGNISSDGPSRQQLDLLNLPRDRYNRFYPDRQLPWGK